MKKKATNKSIMVSRAGRVVPMVIAPGETWVIKRTFTKEWGNVSATQLIYSITFTNINGVLTMTDDFIPDEIRAGIL